MLCEQCILESGIDKRLKNLPQRNSSEHITRPVNAMQIDLVPELPPSGVYKFKVKALGVFSRYLVVYTTSTQDARTVAGSSINPMTKHAHLPITITSENGSVFVFQVYKGVADVLGITLEHATTKHA